jgi:tetraacyldisaccharide 4'-kinase
LLVTGIATPEPLKDHVRTLFANVQHLTFPDHYRFSQPDIRQIAEKWQSLPNATTKLVPLGLRFCGIFIANDFNKNKLND